MAKRVQNGNPVEAVVLSEKGRYFVANFGYLSVTMMRLVSICLPFPYTPFCNCFVGGCLLLFFLVNRARTLSSRADVTVAISVD